MEGRTWPNGEIESPTERPDPRPMRIALARRAARGARKPPRRAGGQGRM